MERKEKELSEIDEIMSSISGDTGELSLPKVKELVQAYVDLQQNASKVYQEVTGGLLSKPHYTSDTVIQIYLDRKNQMIDRATVCEDMLHIVSDEYTQDMIKEYFNRMGE